MENDLVCPECGYKIFDFEFSLDEAVAICRWCSYIIELDYDLAERLSLGVMGVYHG